MTPCTKVYGRFLTHVTDDMYMELSKEETESLLDELLDTAIPQFEFPRVSMETVIDTEKKEIEIPPTEEGGEPTTATITVEVRKFVADLSYEEIEILALYMVVAWLEQQTANVEVTRQFYTGTDFKATSQANHLAKLKVLMNEFERKGFHLQRLYKRRKVDENGVMQSTWGEVMENSTGGYHDSKIWS